MRLSSMPPVAVLALLGSGAAAMEPVELEYRDAMRCSALHSFYAGVSNDEPEATALHRDLSIRWLTLAVARDGQDGKLALKEHGTVVELLVEKLNGMEESPDEIEAFLVKASNICNELQQVNAKEFDAVEVETDAEDAEPEQVEPDPS